MKKLLLLAIFSYSPTFGQSIVDFGSQLELKNRDVKEIQANAKQYVAENPKPFWSMGIINQIEAYTLLTADFSTSIWNVTILDFKLGKTPAMYFYGQARFGSIFGDKVYTTLESTITGNTIHSFNTTSFNYGTLIGMGGKVAEMYTTIGNKDSALISAYVNGGILLESKRFEQAADLAYFSFEVNTYFVYESSFASATLGYSMGFDVINTNPDASSLALSLSMPVRLGLQFGFMF